MPVFNSPVGEMPIVKLHKLSMKTADLGLHILCGIDPRLEPSRLSINVKLVNDIAVVLGTGLEVVLDSKERLADPDTVLELCPAGGDDDQTVIVVGVVGDCQGFE